MIAFGVTAAISQPVFAETIYNNLNVNGAMAMATRPDSGGKFEIETGDDFVLTAERFVTTAKFIGILVGTVAAPTISSVDAEIYRVFPLDSNNLRVPNVPTRANSPSDVAFGTRNSPGELTFSTTVLNATFAAANSVQPGGIHPSPGQTTGGNGPVTGQEVQIELTFTTPFDLPADHYFFIPQVSVNNGEFYWLSASRPISGAGTTPFVPDLQVWTRDANLDPDWLRVGTDIVGGATSPTFNAAFSLEGPAISEPEPSSIMMLATALLLIAGTRGIQRSKLRTAKLSQN
jgi:hypothetical protein